MYVFYSKNKFRFDVLMISYGYIFFKVGEFEFVRGGGDGGSILKSFDGFFIIW